MKRSGQEEEEVKLIDGDLKDLVSKADLDQIALLQKEFSDLQVNSEWTLLELQNSIRVTQIRSLSVESLALMGVVLRVPDIGWFTISPDSVTCSRAFRTNYPELMMRTIACV